MVDVVTTGAGSLHMIPISAILVETLLLLKLNQHFVRLYLKITSGCKTKDVQNFL
ncbi:hypothetical protein SAMN04488122_1664 [Chitinophaga arvensicola]|uniref:Uncharacterized protein n=1 Tax=Chitinophaga arvensicola TaxID=29529 RepID=A0A1I0QQN6_9BACT|nr:hypothetical protein SAMN04488122_1664 [Chitinophaga arvensicola]